MTERPEISRRAGGAVGFIQLLSERLARQRISFFSVCYYLLPSNQNDGDVIFGMPCVTGDSG